MDKLQPWLAISRDISVIAIAIYTLIIGVVAYIVAKKSLNATNNWGVTQYNATITAIWMGALDLCAQNTVSPSTFLSGIELSTQYSHSPQTNFSKSHICDTILTGEYLMDVLQNDYLKYVNGSATIGTA
jgi:hypothetical protein